MKGKEDTRNQNVKGFGQHTSDSSATWCTTLIDRKSIFEVCWAAHGGQPPSLSKFLRDCQLADQCQEKARGSVGNQTKNRDPRAAAIGVHDFPSPPTCPTCLTCPTCPLSVLFPSPPTCPTCPKLPHLPCGHTFPVNAYLPNLPHLPCDRTFPVTAYLPNLPNLPH